MNDMPALVAALHFLRPWWLLGLIPVVAMALLWRAGTQRRGVWQDAVDAHLLPHLLEGREAKAGGRWARWSGLLAAMLAVLALAGPSVRKVEHPLWQAQAPLVVALDLSPATLAQDLPPSRLAQARAKIATLLRERAGGQVALVVFADDAYTVAPLTADAANVALFLDALAPDIMPGDGRPAEAPRVDRAIAWSQRLLRNGGFDHGDILLLTDRADGDAQAEAAKAQGAGYRVLALGLGTAQGGVFETAAGLGRARLDAASLQRLAASGGGVYRPLRAGSDDLRALGVLDPRTEGGAGARGGKVASWRDDGYWLLPLALLLALPLFRRGGAAAMLAALMLMPLVALPAHAQTPAQARDEAGLWRRADQQAYARMQEGVAAYRRQQYDKAIADFAGNPTADGQYNLGNALAKAGRYDEAIAAYDRALKQRPGMADAVANRKAVDAARKRKPPPGQQQQPGPQPSGDPGQQGQPSPRQQDGNPQRDPSASRQPPPPPEPPRDPVQQQQADAAQRQRMQEALARRQQRPPAGDAKPRQAPETPEQRERRLANEAQLQRVPDDPGALLRAKFRLEYERRQGGR